MAMRVEHMMGGGGGGGRAPQGLVLEVEEMGLVVLLRGVLLLKLKLLVICGAMVCVVRITVRM